VGFDGAAALAPQHLAERIHLADQLAQRVATPLLADAD